MKILKNFPYNRQSAVDYAHQWAYRRNPAFYDFEEIGGDCTNFASQCILAGTGVMNFTETYGWYYLNVNYRSPSWTGVVYLYNFLTTNRGVGPYGIEVEQDKVQPGDICQLFMEKGRFQHSPVITVVGSPPTLENIQVAAHSYDADCRPLDTYDFKQIRFIHILGYRMMSEKTPVPEVEVIKPPVRVPIPKPERPEPLVMPPIPELEGPEPLVMPPILDLEEPQPLAMPPIPEPEKHSHP